MLPHDDKAPSMEKSKITAKIERNNLFFMISSFIAKANVFFSLYHVNEIIATPVPSKGKWAEDKLPPYDKT